MNPFSEKLQQFVNDEVMFNSVKNVLLANCDLNKLYEELRKIDVLSTQDIASRARAWGEARELIEKGFKDLEAYRHGPKKETERQNVV